jgi:copper chaperone CopZ
MNYSKILFLKLICLFLLTHTTVNGEIQKIQVKWNPVSCNAACAQGVLKELRKVRGITAVDVDSGTGQANIQWDPSTPFSFERIKIAMQMIGPYINDIRLWTRGKIRHSNQTISLVSSGDNSQFILVGLPEHSPTGYVEQYSGDVRHLSDDMRDQLLDAESQDLFVNIQGPLFLPYYGSPLKLIVEKMNIENPQQNNPS